MIESLSLFECPHCKGTVEGRPGVLRSCIRCNLLMKEVRKGVITKEAPVVVTKVVEPPTAPKNVPNKKKRG